MHPQLAPGQPFRRLSTSCHWQSLPLVQILFSLLFVSSTFCLRSQRTLLQNNLQFFHPNASTCLLSKGHCQNFLRQAPSFCGSPKVDIQQANSPADRCDLYSLVSEGALTSLFSTDHEINFFSSQLDGHFAVPFVLFELFVSVCISVSVRLDAVAIRFSIDLLRTFSGFSLPPGSSVLFT